MASDDVAIRQLADESIQHLRASDSSIALPGVISIPTFGEIYAHDEAFEPLPARKRDLNAQRFIMHSSGRPLLY